MAKSFKGKIALDIRDSVPDWEPFVPSKAPAGAPTVDFAVSGPNKDPAMPGFTGTLPCTWTTTRSGPGRS